MIYLSPLDEKPSGTLKHQKIGFKFMNTYRECSDDHFCLSYFVATLKIQMRLQYDFRYILH